MRWLIIGGTRFLGRHFTEAALGRGDEVTLFNRGLSGEPPLGARQITGDRRGDLSVLDDPRLGEFDAVIDMCAFLPGEVTASARRLRDRVRRYVLVSSVSVYADARQPNPEDAPLAELPDGFDTKTFAIEQYGALKAACEHALCAEFEPERCLLLRPGLIVGPHDPTGRFTWWVAHMARVADGASVLAPGPADQPVQCIDARDLVQALLTLLDARAHGPFNLTSPPDHWTLEAVLAACAAGGGRRIACQWVDADWLLGQGVQPWTDLPLWLPARGEHAAFMRVPVGRAATFGLSLRPLIQTVVDTLSWWQRLPTDQQGFAHTGLTLERERALLQAWAEVRDLAH